MDPSDRLDSPTALSDHDRGLVIRRRSSDTLMPRECCRCRVRARLGSRSRSRSNLSHPDSVLVLGFSFPFPRRLGRRRSSCCCCRFFLLPRRVIQIQRLLVPRNGSERGNPRGRVVGVVSLWDWRTTREGLTGRRDGESAGGTTQGLGREGEGTVPESTKTGQRRSELCAFPRVMHLVQSDGVGSIRKTAWCSLDLGAAVVLLLPTEEEGLDVFERVRVERCVESADGRLVSWDDRGIVMLCVDLEQQDEWFRCTGSSRVPVEKLVSTFWKWPTGRKVWTYGGPLL